MIRALIFFAVVAGIAWGIAWLADVPGTVTVNLEGQELEIQVDLFFVVVGLLVIVPLLILFWTLLVRLVTIPSGISQSLLRRKEARGLEALSNGMIAVSSGNRYLAEKQSAAARRSLPNEPLTALLRAQTAQICGDRLTARRIYQGMLSSPDTEVLGLRGLFLEAQKENEFQAARQFAERAVKLDPKLTWAVNSLFEYQCRAGDWEDALRTLDVARHNSHVTKAQANRRKAVLLTAQAQVADERGDIDRAIELAQHAHGLAPDLVPASEIAGRLLASKGHTSRAAKILTKTWKLSPHPDLAYAFAFARPGDSPRDRLKRVQTLAALTPHNVEGPIAQALAAVDAREWQIARESLKRLIRDRPSARVCTLMARIEAGEFGDKGRVREWLARGLRAPRDPSWIAEGYVSDHWLPISPVTGKIDAFEWKVPMEPAADSESDVFVEELMQVGSVAKEVLADPAKERGSGLVHDITPTVAGDAKLSDETKKTNAHDREISQAGDETEDVSVVSKSSPSLGDSKLVESESVERDSAAVAGTRSKSSLAGANGSTKVSEASVQNEIRPISPDDADEREGARPVKSSGDQPQSAASVTRTEAPKSTGERTSEEVERTSPKPDKVSPDKTTGKAQSVEADEKIERRKPKIFVPPRAPDDPGPEPLDPDEARTALARYRTSPVKTD